MEGSGLNLAFQIIFAEIVSKNIPESDVFAYTAERLKHIGGEMRGLGNVLFFYLLNFLFINFA